MISIKTGGWTELFKAQVVLFLRLITNDVEFFSVSCECVLFPLANIESDSSYGM